MVTYGGSCGRPRVYIRGGARVRALFGPHGRFKSPRARAPGQTFRLRCHANSSRASVFAWAVGRRHSHSADSPIGMPYHPQMQPWPSSGTTAGNLHAFVSERRAVVSAGPRSKQVSRPPQPWKRWEIPSLTPCARLPLMHSPPADRLHP